MEEEREARGVSTFPADSLYLQLINITQEVGHTHFEADKDPTKIQPNPRPHEPNAHLPATTSTTTTTTTTTTESA